MKAKKLRRRIEDALRKTATLKQMILIADILTVKYSDIIKEDDNEN